jgi:tetratricopeptide (TPR) repeat protein
MGVIKRATALGVLTISTAALAGGGKLEPDDLPPPQPEVVKSAAKIEVPPVPAFELPATEPGFHGPRELHVHGKPVLDTEIKVKGYVTWIYECAAALASGNPKATRGQIQAAIDKDPTLCERPKFYLGDAKGTSRDASIWVVDAPRLPTKVERERLPKEELKAWPAVPRLAVGDYVVVTGTWAITSPHAEHNTDGLLVYKALDHATPGAPSAAAAPPVDAAKPPEITVVTQAPLRKAVDDATRNTSIDRTNACNKAIAARQYDAAIAACQAATQAWEGNHLAWYVWASAHMAKNEWQKARTAIEHAVTLRPDQGMYQLYYGISLYEAALQQAREDQARKEQKKPEEVTVNPAQLKLDAARDALWRATRLAPDLWRAHYYLGRVYRDLDDAKHAAEQFSETIRTYPAYRFGYIALIELYRRWDYLDQALAVATLGTTRVPPSEATELWFEVGMAYDAKHVDDKAIEAFSQAITSKPDNASAKFQRGQIYVRKGNFAGARRDLEEVIASTDPRIAPLKPIAQQVLAQIAGKH